MKFNVIEDVIQISKDGYDMMYDYHVNTFYWIIPFDGLLVSHIIGLDVLECIEEVLKK